MLYYQKINGKWREEKYFICEPCDKDFASAEEIPECPQCGNRRLIDWEAPESTHNDTP